MADNSLIPFINTEQMIEVDRAMLEDYKISLIQMMENAGHNLASLARRRFLGGEPNAKTVAILAGSGGNGGGALVAARHLHNWGADVSIYLGQNLGNMAAVPAQQLEIVKRMGIVIAIGIPKPTLSFDLIVDGLIGYSLTGAPRKIIRELILWANEKNMPILALDTPSGIDTNLGTVYEPAIEAVATMTLALPKKGLKGATASKHVGELYLADIGVPPGLYARPPLKLEMQTLFTQEEILRIW